MDRLASRNNELDIPGCGDSEEQLLIKAGRTRQNIFHGSHQRPDATCAVNGPGRRLEMHNYGI